MGETLMLQRIVASLALAVAAACAFAASAMADTVKIGLIIPYSGPFAQAGDEMDKGLRLYIKEHEKDLPPDLKVELVVRDSTGPNPDVAKRLAQELITRDHVQLLSGLVESPKCGRTKASHSRTQGNCSSRVCFSDSRVLTR